MPRPKRDSTDTAEAAEEAEEAEAAEAEATEAAEAAEVVEAANAAAPLGVSFSATAEAGVAPRRSLRALIACSMSVASSSVVKRGGGESMRLP